MLTAYVILILCSVVPEAPSNIAQEKIQAMSSEQQILNNRYFSHTVYICIYQILHVKKM